MGCLNEHEGRMHHAMHADSYEYKCPTSFFELCVLHIGINAYLNACFVCNCGVCGDTTVALLDNGGEDKLKPRHMPCQTPYLNVARTVKHHITFPW